VFRARISHLYRAIGGRDDHRAYQEQQPANDQKFFDETQQKTTPMDKAKSRAARKILRGVDVRDKYAQHLYIIEKTLVKRLQKGVYHQTSN